MIRQRKAIQLEAAPEPGRSGVLPFFEHLHVIVARRELHQRPGQHVHAARGERARDVEDGNGVELPLELELLRDVALPLELRQEAPPTHEVPRHVDVEGQLALVLAVEGEANSRDVGVERQGVVGAGEHGGAPIESDDGDEAGY